MEAGGEAFSYVLHSGRTGTVHVEQVLEYNQDPTYLRDLLAAHAREAAACQEAQLGTLVGSVPSDAVAAPVQSDATS